MGDLILLWYDYKSMVIGAVGVGIPIVPYRVEEGPRPDIGHVPTQDQRMVAKHVTGAQGKRYNAKTTTAQVTYTSNIYIVVYTKNALRASKVVSFT